MDQLNREHQSTQQQTKRSPNASVATSYGEEISRLTGQTGRSWGNPRKIPKEIDFSDETEFPPIQVPNMKSNGNQNQHNPSTINDESNTDTTVIQQAIDTALKKALEEHRREITEMQNKFNKQLEIIQQQQQQQQNTSTLEMKFDKLLEMLASGNNNVTRESPFRKKGKPNNLEATTFSQVETPTRSNRQPANNASDMEMDIEEDEEPPMGPHFDQEILFDQEITDAIGNDDTITTPAEPSENEWIVKEKKEKRTQKMTQTKIFDMMTNGGYGNGKGSPSRNPVNQSPSRIGRTTPPRPGRGTPPRPTQSERNDRTQVVLTKLPSPQLGDPKQPKKYG